MKYVTSLAVGGYTFYIVLNFRVVFDFSCPVSNDIISPFVYNSSKGVAEATLYSMFKFPDSNQVHFQCDIQLCRKTGTVLILYQTLKKI